MLPIRKPKLIPDKLKVRISSLQEYVLFNMLMGPLHDFRERSKTRQRKTEEERVHTRQTQSPRVPKLIKYYRELICRMAE